MMKFSSFPNTPGKRMSSAEHTRLALVRAALQLFGEKGFAATTTREIAAQADANIGSISYHFGGKEGLRLACADHIVALLSHTTGKAIDLGETESGSITAEQAEALLSKVVEAMASFAVANPEAGPIAQFVQRELSQPSEALERIYQGVFLPVHSRLCRIWEAATGLDAESDETKLTVFTLLGQLLYFRIAGPAVQKRMAWSQTGPREAQAIAEVVRRNLKAVLADRRRAGKP